MTYELNASKSKVCSICGEEKFVSEFYRHPTASLFCGSKCKECSKKSTHELRHPGTERKPLIQHGMHGTKEYRIWQHILKRCNNKNMSNYVRYGGKGVTVCKEWEESFVTFFKDMGAIGSFDSIDRIENSKGYSKENCRWATIKQQANNKTSNVLAEIDGVTRTVAQWAEHIGVSSKSIYNRIYRGSTPVDAVKHFAKGKL